MWFISMNNEDRQTDRQALQYCSGDVQWGMDLSLAKKMHKKCVKLTLGKLCCPMSVERFID